MPSDKVLAIDPGFDRVGLAVMVLDGGSPKHLFSKCLVTDPSKTREKRILSIGKEVKDIIKKWKPKDLAIETLFFNTNITSALGVAEARGVIIYEATKMGLKIFEYGPQTIKIAVTNYGRATKDQMSIMVQKLVTLPEKSSKRLDDEVDALALGITHLATKRSI